jgi:aspartate aminotransferase
LVAAGGRPLIYSLFRAICDKGDKIIYAVPSWNNNHYAHFVEGRHAVIEALAENDFMPTVEEIRPHLKGAILLSLCSPQNPTGTTFGKDALKAICDLVLAENSKRSESEKKLYVMYDQMYWHLTFGNIVHYNPVSLCPELQEFTIFIDAISKVFAATGLRVGWAMGPANIIFKMKAILTHLGAWAPMAEQKAVAVYLQQKGNIDIYLSKFKSEVEDRLRTIYDGFSKLKREGFSVDAIVPQAAIYLTVKIDLTGKKTSNGTILNDQGDVTAYILNEANLALVPFYAFGSSGNSPWYRLSIGTCKKEEINDMFGKLRAALRKLS